MIKEAEMLAFPMIVTVASSSCWRRVNFLFPIFRTLMQRISSPDTKMITSSARRFTTKTSTRQQYQGEQQEEEPFQDGGCARRGCRRLRRGRRSQAELFAISQRFPIHARRDQSDQELKFHSSALAFKVKIMRTDKTN